MLAMTVVKIQERRKQVYEEQMPGRMILPCRISVTNCHNTISRITSAHDSIYESRIGLFPHLGNGQAIEQRMSHIGNYKFFKYI